MSEETVEVPTADATQEQAATEAASIAAVGAVVASETATEAKQTADVAVQEASEAQTTALEALTATEQTREAASEAITAVAEGTVSRQDFEAFQNQVAPVLKRFADMEAERIANEQKDEGVEEIDVTDGGTATGTDGNSGTGTGNTGHDGQSSERAAARRGLRHRHSR